MPISKPVVASTGGITLAGLATTIATVIQALQGHPTNAGGLISGNLLTVVGLIGTIVHVHKGAQQMATQNDVENVVTRIRGAWHTLVNHGGIQRAEVDLSSLIGLAEELEAAAEKVAPSGPVLQQFAADQAANTSADTTAPTAADTSAPSAGSDFSKLS